MLELWRDDLEDGQEHVDLHGEVLGHGYGGLELLAAGLCYNFPSQCRRLAWYT